MTPPADPDGLCFKTAIASNYPAIKKQYMIIAVTLPTIAVDSSAQRTPIIHFSLFIIPDFPSIS